MEAARPRRRRRQARRGTVENAVNTRLVRVAAVVIVPAALALLFSISPTGALPRPPLAPVFDTRSATDLAGQLSTEFPERIPGTVTAQESARWYAETMSGLGLDTVEDTWVEELADLGEVELRNEVTVVAGRSEEAIVLVAHRDNAGADESSGDNVSGTAALIELARGYSPQGALPDPLPDRTLVFVSTDAGAYGGAGARRFANTSPYADAAVAVIVLDGLGGRGQPRLEISGGRPNSPARVLVRTAAARIEEQAGEPPDLPSLLTQLLDLALPFAPREQGFFLARGVAAITVTTARPDGSDAGDVLQLSSDRLGQLGRSAEAIVGSLDVSAGTTLRAPDSIFLDGRAASGWTVRLLLVTAVAPFAIGVVDLLTRCRRRRLPLAGGVRALRARLVFWLFAGVLLWIAGVTHALPTGAALPLPTYASFLADVPVAALLVLSIALAGAWVLNRRRLAADSPPATEERLAGFAVALGWLALVAVYLAVTKPYALVFVLPSLYAWIWLPGQARIRSSAPVYALGLIGPLAALVVLAHELSLNLLQAPLYLAGLATDGYLSAASVVTTLAWCAAAAQIGALALGRYGPYAAGLEPPPPGPVRLAARWAREALRERAQASGR